MNDDHLAWIVEKQNDPRTNEELFQTARIRSEEDDDPGWNAIRVLHARGTRDIFDAACQLCLSPNATERALGVDILGQLGRPERAFPEETLALLLTLLESERAAEVLQAIAVSLGHLHDARAIEPLVKLKNHPDADVRHGLTFALGGHEDDLAIATLIELSSDECACVRDWATFGLGDLNELDTEEIRNALFQRLEDEDADTRGEAIFGLAQRKDPRAVEAILNELAAGRHGPQIFGAALEIVDPRLYPALLQFKEKSENLSDYEKEWLEDAINHAKETRKIK